MNESLDRLLAYRNFLAAEDHCCELLYSPESEKYKAFITGIKNELEYLRDDVMPKEVNKEFHCLVKHVATAYEACSEVAKATHEDLDIYRAEATRKILIDLLEKLWGRKIIACERCGVKEDDESRRIQKEVGRDSSDPFDGGISRDSVEGSSRNREPIVFGGEIIGYYRDEIIHDEREADGGEGEDNADSDWDADGEDCIDGEPVEGITGRDI